MWEGFPFRMERFPFRMEGFPFRMERFPFRMEGFPFPMEGFPFPMEGFHRCRVAVPAVRLGRRLLRGPLAPARYLPDRCHDASAESGES